LSQQVTFWIAVMSVLAFVAGNMVGQHGWHVFWKSVMGGVDDSLIVYTGTVTPIEKVPDYVRWAKYGGNPHLHTFREVPQDVLVPLPTYSPATQNDDSHPMSLVYSIGHLGSYETGGDQDGSHPGIDIRVPVGTPIRSIAAGIVTSVDEDRGGFGTYVVVRHPNVPDPDRPSKTTTLYSVYAHLSSASVVEGEIVTKGQQIALSGQSGFATGPHLHFQIDRDIDTTGEKVPYHPYWPFTNTEARAVGLTFNSAVNSTVFLKRGLESFVSPLLYIQAQHAPVQVAKKPAAPAAVKQVAATLDERVKLRLARRQATLVATAAPKPVVATDSAVGRVNSVTPVAVAEPVPTPAPAKPAAPATPVSGPVAGVEIRHDGAFSGRTWETVTLTLLDASGNPVTSPTLDRDLYLRTAFGQAEFRPSVLTSLDFQNGKASVQVLPTGQKTLIIQVQPLGAMSAPMVFRKE